MRLCVCVFVCLCVSQESDEGDRDADGAETPLDGGAAGGRRRRSKGSLVVFVMAALVGILVSYMASGEQAVADHRCRQAYRWRRRRLRRRPWWLMVLLLVVQLNVVVVHDGASRAVLHFMQRVLFIACSLLFPSLAAPVSNVFNLSVRPPLVLFPF